MFLSLHKEPYSESASEAVPLEEEFQINRKRKSKGTKIDNFVRQNIKKTILPKKTKSEAFTLEDKILIVDNDNEIEITDEVKRNSLPGIPFSEFRFIDVDKIKKQPYSESASDVPLEGNQHIINRRSKHQPRKSAANFTISKQENKKRQKKGS